MNWRVLLLGLLAFTIALVVVLPARWAGSFLPAQVSCGEWAGTLWRGTCMQLTVRPPRRDSVTIASTSWKLHPVSLLRGRIAADVAITDVRGDVTGRVEVGSKGLLVLSGVSARVNFDPQLPVATPEGWTGRAEVRQLELEMRANELRRLQGEIGLFDLRDENGQEMGNYQANFPPATAAPFRGQVADKGGPFEVQGTLELTADRQWSIDGKVAARPGNTSNLARNLAILGAPDASGRYPLQAAGSFR